MYAGQLVFSQIMALLPKAVDKSTGLQCDQTIILAGFYPSKDYPEPLRRIRYYDCEIQKRFMKN